MAPQPHDVEYFTSPDEFRAWLVMNHATRSELWVGFHKKATGRPTLTWSESVDQALCFGWIDGIRMPVDDERYANRFTPRRKGSNWSAVNLGKVEALMKAGLMTPTGMAAYGAREPDSSQQYPSERRDIPFATDAEATFRANADAWTFFLAQPPGYQKLSRFWVMSAKREETRRSRLAQLIDDSARGRRINQLNQTRQKSHE